MYLFLYTNFVQASTEISQSQLANETNIKDNTILGFGLECCNSKEIDNCMHKYVPVVVPCIVALCTAVAADLVCPKGQQAMKRD